MKKTAWLVIILITLVKLLFLFTHHIQEDAFITWRVAQNIIDYGVIGYNGVEKISSSTTYLYMFFSAIFNLIFGKEGFMYPLIITNAFLFTIGSYFLSKIFFTDWQKQVFLMVFVNFVPSSLVASCLGMEYGLIFFLYGGFLYYGLYKNKNWALVLFPFLLLWTRLDTIILLGLSGLVYTFKYRRLNWSFILGGLAGIITVLAFNYFYFGDWINHTISAKSIAYQEQEQVPLNWYIMKAFFNINQIKYMSFWIIIPGLVFVLFSIYSFYKLLSIYGKNIAQSTVLISLMLFAIIKWLIFSSRLANFDWYYWLPKTVLMAIIILYILNLQFSKTKLSLFALFITAPMLLYQIIHSTATGNGEWNYRREIGVYLDKIESDKSQYIMLEPAGYIPYFSGLKAIDEVGLVDKRITYQMEKDFDNWWYNSITEYQPKYLLTTAPVGITKNYKLNETQTQSFFDEYKLEKEFRIKEALNSENPILNKIYHLKPSGRNYYLYIKK